MQSKKTGVLLVNLGTPNTCTKKDVRLYLKQFLADPRVIDIPSFFRFLLLYLIILPFRTPKATKAYKKIWLNEGSPLRVHSQLLSHRVQNKLGQKDYVVELGMRYQNPSIDFALKKLMSQNVKKIIVLPLFPQYSSAANGSALQEVYSKLSSHWNVLPISTMDVFYENKYFIQCFVDRIKETLNNFKIEYVLFSYHGLPERHISKSVCGVNKCCLKKSDCCAEINIENSYCYRAQCFATTRAIVAQLNLEKGTYSNAFQSRLGRTKWIEPYTDTVLPELAHKGIKNIALACPAFVADCLETLEEIAMRAKEQWKELGGENLVLVPSLNAQNDWCEAVVAMIKEHESGN